MHECSDLVPATIAINRVNRPAITHNVIAGVLHVGREMKRVVEGAADLPEEGLNNGCPNGHSKCTKWSTCLFSNITGLTSDSLGSTTLSSENAI